MTELLPNIWEFIAIVAMGITTYFTRVSGFLWLRSHGLSPRARAVLEASPSCVTISVAAPAFMTTDPLMLIALAFTVLIAFRVNLSVTIVSSVVFMAFLQYFFR